jgi:ribosomal protein S18 acetylase RimI-like enzyme
MAHDASEGIFRMSKASVEDCSIRKADESDLNLLIDLGIRTFNETFAHLNSAEDMEAYMSEAFHPSQVASELADETSTFLIAERNNVAVGYAKLARGHVPDSVSDDSAIELARLYVLKEAFGAGVGSALMNAMLELAVAEGFRTMWLGVWEHNERAKAFYRKCSFHEVGSHVFQLGSDAQTDLLMERTL